MELSTDDRNFMFAVIRRIVRCDYAADDATQDALVSAYRHYASFRGESALRTWLYRIAVTTALGYLRKQRRSREAFLDDVPVKQVADPALRPDELALARERFVHARAAVDRLGTAHREVVELRLAEFTEPEIAVQLGISIANVKIRAHRAREQLRYSIRVA